MTTPPDPTAADEEPWLSDPATEDALRATVPRVVPPRSVGLYVRWWQLETWLRELIHVELRALYGQRWIDVVKMGAGRQATDAAFTHMTGADNDNPLAYLDYSQLLKIIDDHWPQFQQTLLEKQVWDGQQVMLKQIRHRIGHMRRPHADDLSRLEQVLRDLERGAFIAMASYNEDHAPSSRKHADAVTQGWVAGKHDDARRLLDHSRDRYGVAVSVTCSRRPWAAWPDDLDGAPGVLWHVNMFMHGRTIDGRALWRDSSLDRFRPLLVHALAPSGWHVGFTLSAVDGAAELAAVIGPMIEAVLRVSRTGDADLDEHEVLAARSRNVDYRLMSDNSGWAIVDSSTLPISNFDAGGGVTSLPRW